MTQHLRTDVTGPASPTGEAGPARALQVHDLHAASGDEPDVVRTVLPGGLRLVTERVPGVRSVTFGVWVGVGSRSESPSEAGCSHFLEHLLFKGTDARDAKQIAVAMDAVGGEMNAFTTKEYTCYYARVLSRDTALAVELVSDLVTGSLIRAEDVDSERGVVLEEIAMNDDDPADLAHEALTAALFGDSPVGRPVLGTVESITTLAADTVRGYYRAHYRPDAMVVAVSGDLDHDTVREQVQASFARAGLPASIPAGPLAVGAIGQAPSTGRLRYVERATEQANLVLGLPGLARGDDRRFALSVLVSALGGGMSSRLFQLIREEHGLAYSVYAFTESYADTGMVGVYVGCQADRVPEVVGLVREVLADVVAHGIGEDELRLAQGQITGGIALGMEDTAARMTHLGKSELVFGEVVGVDELVRRIDTVTADEVRALAAELFAAAPSLGLVGPFGDVADLHDLHDLLT